MRACEHCGKQIDEHVPFCGYCGTATTRKTTAVDEWQDVEKAIARKRKLPMAVVLIAAVLLVAAVVVLGLYLFLWRNNVPYGVYLKNNNLMMVDTRSGETWELAKDGGDQVLFSEDGSTVFFVADLDEYGYGTLCTCSTNDKTPKITELCKNVGKDDFVISSDGSVVWYVDKNMVLYRDDLKERQKIDTLGTLDREGSEGHSVYLSLDGEQVYYLQADGVLYGVQGDKKSLVAENVGDFVTSDEQLNTVYYRTKNGVLYKKERNNVRSKQIDTDVSYIATASASGEMYYAKNAEPLSYLTFVDTTAGYNSALVDEIEALDGISYLEELVYYDGTKAISLTTTKCSGWWSSCTDEKEVSTAYLQYDVDRITKVPLSDIATAEQLKEAIDEALYACQSCYVAVGEQTILINLEESDMGYGRAYFATPRKFYFSFTRPNDDGYTYTYNVYYVDVSDGVGDPKMIAEAVWSGIGNVVGTANGTAYATCGGKLYKDGELIEDDNVVLFDTVQNSDRDTVLYWVGADWEKAAMNPQPGLDGTLMMIKDGGDPVKIADSCAVYGRCHDWLSYAVAFSGDDVLYLRDWDTKEHEGDLYLYKNGESTLVDNGAHDVVTGYTVKQLYEKQLYEMNGSNNMTVWAH